MKHSTNTLKNYLEKRPLFFSLIRPIEAKLFNKQNTFIKKPILDYGCGDGFFAKSAFYKFIPIDVGIDIDKQQLKKAKDKKVYKKLIYFDGNKLPLASNSFKTILSNCVLEHVEHLPENLKELNRVMKRGGFFITSVMTNNWENNMIGSRLFGKIYKRWMREKQIHYNLLSKDQWNEAFKISGFKVVKIYPYLNKRQSTILDMVHYFSTPSLLWIKLTNRWVLFPSVVGSKFIQKITNKINCSRADISTSSALFYVLEKK